jgi:type II secretory pathway component GspD/PulD (secretin)
MSNVRDGIVARNALRPLVRALFCCCCALASAQSDGLRFNRLAFKDPQSLAPKAGGLTERIEIQSTDDHIDYVIKTYTLHHANAAEVFELIQLAVDKEGGTVSRISPGSVGEIDEHALTCTTAHSGASLLVVTVPDWMLPYLDETIAQLDRPDLQAAAFGTLALYARIKHRLPSEVAELIAETAASPFIVLKPDDTRQILYLEDTPSYFNANLEALRMFDQPPPQIETRVRIFEIKETDTRDVGLDWIAWKRSVAGGGLVFQWEGAPGSYQLDLQSFAAELSFSPQLAIDFLNYLAGRGHATIVTDSRLTQTNSRTATVQSVLQIPYVVGIAPRDASLRDSPHPVDPDGAIREFVEGVIVEMTPRISEEIELDVQASVSSHIGYTPQQNVPLIAESQLQTVALLTPGKPAVLGGLTRENRITERSGVIGLRSVPGLRWLFSREVQRLQTSQIIVTIQLDRVLAGQPQQITDAARPPAAIP